MKNEENWMPSRFIMKNDTLRISKDPAKLAISSRLNATLAVECFNKWIPERCHGRLLDLGCGTVPYYELYRPFVDDIFCVDWEGSAHDLSHVDLACDLTQKLPMRDDDFDAILLSSVLEHLPDPQLLFDEMYRILRPNGVLFLNVPFLYWVHEAPNDYFRYTEFALRRFSKNSGFEVEGLEPLGGGLHVMADTFAKMAVQLGLIGKPLASLCQSATELFCKTKIGKRMSDQTKSRMPSGYFLVASKTA